MVNTEFPAPLLMNAIGHVALGLLGARDPSRWNLLDYPSPAFDVDSHISEYPVVILRSKRSAPLEKLVRQLKDFGIDHNVFIDSMVGRTADEQRQATLDASPGKDRISCVALFGDEEAIRPLIRSFSVYKTSDTASVELAT